MAGNVQNIKLGPAELAWVLPETTSVACISASTLAGKYFNIWSALDAVAYYVWFDDGVAADPAPAGKTAIAVSIVGTETAAQVATLLAAALDLEADFNAKVDFEDSTKVRVETVGYGATTASVDVDTTMVLVEERIGYVFDLGFTEGDLEIALNEDLVDITAHQTGTTIQDRARSGINIDAISVVMKETDVDKLKVLIGQGAGNVNVIGAEETVSIGVDKLFGHTSDQSKRLVFHPVRNDASDLSGDWAFNFTYPRVASYVFSGENPQTMTVEFNVLPDRNLLEGAQHVIIGDHTLNHLR